MSWRSAAFTLGGLLLAAATVLWLFERQISAVWFGLGLRPEVLAVLERSLDDQKELARLDPEGRAAYRRRFEETRELLQHLRILEHNRPGLLRRSGMVLLALVGGLLVIGGSAHLVRMAAVREETARLRARDRRRLAELQNLSGWQETARRHAHEMKTPLTAARLELARLQQLAGGEAPPPSDEVRQVAGSVVEELDRLGRFAQELTGFARLQRPRRERHDLHRVVADFAGTFAAAWPNLELRLEPRPAAGADAFTVEVDREMLRRALVNLCDNSALALPPAGLPERPRGTVVFRLEGLVDDVALDVTDDGPGIPEEVRPRVFEPYVTTRPPGEGMGLGLAIAKKILLDHGGDLELRTTSPEGTTFRLLLPRPPGELPDPEVRS